MSELPARVQMLVNRVGKNARHLRKWARREHISCYRLYDKDIPEVPLAIDWYDGRLHIAEYERRVHGEVVIGPEAWVESAGEAVADSLAVDRAQVFIKTRRRQRGRDQYEAAGQSGDRFAVREGDASFWVNLVDYLDTGLFLDHRSTRAMVAAEAADKRLLNLFCYTGAFTVHAAVTGAASSLSIDMSHTYLDWARENLQLNEVDLRNHQLLRADAVAFLRDPPRNLARFDIAVLDPPTFSNSKRMQGVLDVQRDHAALINATLALLRPGGVLYFSTNLRRFRLDTEAVEPNCGARIADISQRTIPPDFRNKRIHHCFRITAGG